MHIKQLSTPHRIHQPMLMRLDALAQDIKIPRRHACDAAEDELQSGIEQFERFGPLPRFVRVLLFGVFFDLPGTPDFVADGPVFDLVVRELEARLKGSGESNIRSKVLRVHSGDGDWRSECRLFRCSTRPKPVLVWYQYCEKDTCNRSWSRPSALTIFERAGAHVEAEIGLAADKLAPLTELIGAYLVGLDTEPS